MYIKFEDLKTSVTNKIELIEEVCDSMMLTLYIKPLKPMNEIYELFIKNNLSSITIYNMDDSMYGVYNGYDTIESFIFNPVANYYVISLSKKGVSGLRAQIDEQKIQLDKLVTDVGVLKDSIDKLVVSQTVSSVPKV